MLIPRIPDQEVREALQNRKVLFLLGPRQVGKTTLIKEVIKTTGGIILNLDLEVDKAKFLAAAKLTPKDAMKFLGVSNILVIDEAHRFPEVGRIVKGWYDAEVTPKIILLGSSSLNLLDQTAENLTGRNEKLYLTPLLFSEILRQKEWFSPEISPTKTIASFHSQIQSTLLEHLIYGSYPEAFTTTDKEKYLLTLVEDYLLKDVLHPDIVKSPDHIKRLLLLLAYQVGSEVSISELASNLGASRQTVERYLDLLERTFVIFRLSAYSTNPRKEITKSTKVYFWDTGVKNALQNEFVVSDLRSDIGSLWENWVIAEANKRNLTLGLNQSLFFWRTLDGSEVDLVVKEKGKISAFEIKWSSQKKPSSRASFKRRHGADISVVNRDNFLELLQ